ncbi:hypothetical protein HDU78_003749 [Chytriomyces hyalinus]|nr:hypothetical protein HDU77_008884 [Chytriomyces hyalinus]KAJ3247636.1 hypothetical protein HDU78_003749 [Chytriomyces hyalinus]
MQLTHFAAIAAFAVSSATAQCSGNPGATCMTSGGSWLSIINPGQGSSYQAGQDLMITWDACGNDDAFKSSTIQFIVVDAKNPNNIADLAGGIGALAGSPKVTDGQFKVKIPDTIPAGEKYALKSVYRDAAATKWVNCFGVTFAISNSAAVVPTSGGNATVSQTPAAAAPTSKSGAASLVAAGSAAVIAGVLAL